MHRRAQTGDVDVFLPHARKDELIAICPRHIEPQPRALPASAIGWPREKPSIDQIARMTGSRKRIDEIRPHLVATHADAGPECRGQVRGIDSQLIAEGLDRDSRRACGRPAPPRVHGGHGAGSCVRQQQWDAVGCSHGNRHVGMIGDEDVGFRSFDRKRLSTTDDYSAITVHLGKRHNR